MNKTKNIWWMTLAISLVLLQYSCDKKEYHFEYKAEPKTETGRKLVDGTDLFAQIFTDTMYTVTDGVVASEIEYLSQKGLAMKIFIFDVDLSHPNVDIVASSPNNANAFAMQRMTEQAVHADNEINRVWAGINGDFYNMDNGTPRGVFYKKGVALRTTFDGGDRSFFAIGDDGLAFVATREEYPDIAAAGVIKEAVGGSVTLLREGNVLTHTDNTIEPRTCIGVSADGKRVFMMAVDGRNFWYSNGMLFEELGHCLKALGAENGINLDGGGSTTFFVRHSPDFTEDRFKVRNWPTDNGGQERSVANGLLIISE
ncbi:phosphodiester glycosidase family protein [Sphingobacterium gobiense]|uniref:Exopolysaccharide biosynthesis protein n=1 Tax=Sphingobacterium gobiense TaxID=1382456 RepID=A0A2S9JIB5_9SPHI|nr:phosphodiester glycosidase family protein [Sphingobacterium gobiense]PRD52750.1 exopolysaccharide biosynthesis protein [Sphingobacterium gobiense]